MKDALMAEGWPEHPIGVRRKKGKAIPADEPGLFAQAASVRTGEILGMVHGNDPVTSQAAAVRAKPGVHALQQRILAVLAQHGPLTALELEKWPELRDAGEYNVRRRCSDLYTAGKVRRVGVREGAGLLEIAP